jgi:pyruvate/2-oxoacid:ferredoxin oxidoreductase beta subunit/Pyruvate/2-oxoacid:ferredoxin oxidoreductase delta subunit
MADEASMLGSVLDVADFHERIVGAYNDGTGDAGLAADLSLARSLIPAGTGAARDFSYIAPDLPAFDASRCVGCMNCVTQCPDTAILAKVVPERQLEAIAANLPHDDATALMARMARTAKYHEHYALPIADGREPGMFGIFVDPSKCKGCGECVDVCGDHQALMMVPKDDGTLDEARRDWGFYAQLPETPAVYVRERLLIDMMLAGKSLLYCGGAGSCMGCGEATAIRMMLAATGFSHGADSIGIVASTGCNTVFGATYPFNPYKVSWTNSLFENAPAMAMGVRMRWDQQGWQDKKLWVIGGDGAMLDIGFQSLSRMLASGMDIKVLVLDTQVYSNTGGQTSTASFTGQVAKFSAYGSEQHGKSERRKELAQICIMHPNVFVAQTTAAHPNHFYKAIQAANEFHGPAVVIVYTTCQPEHGVGDAMANHQAKLAVDSRAFPLLIHDPRQGETLKARLSLQGNPLPSQDWYTVPKTGEVVDFISFARTEQRFAKHFDKDGQPSETLLAAKADRLANWRLLQELAGVLPAQPVAKEAK